jgi:peptide-methionine (S)-S-oxide reductase
LEKLLEIFFLAHDPTTLNKQGHYVGEQYRSIILYENEEQRRKAQEIIKEMERAGKFPGPIVTELKKLEKFYPAEEEHRNYWSRNPEQAYCQLVIAPKVAEVKQKLSEKNTSDGS